MRLDQRVAEILGVSRNRAQFFVEHGLVSIDEKVVTKQSFETTPEMKVQINEEHPQIHYVSRSAEKLATFLEKTGISVVGFRCLDIGASTGGFTQVLLEKGAIEVVAIDIGTAQLHSKLQGDTRIISRENTDIRTWKTGEKFSRIVVDVSFVSLKEILPTVGNLLDDAGVVVALFKPQFEVGISGISKSGVPKTEKIRLQALHDFREWMSKNSFKILAEYESSLSGEAGNREVLFSFSK